MFDSTTSLYIFLFMFLANVSLLIYILSEDRIRKWIKTLKQERNKPHGSSDSITA